jgi:hypothetical protein
VAENNVKIIETGLGGGQTDGRLCRIKNLAARARGEIELVTIRGADGKTFLASDGIRKISAPRSNQKVLGAI